MCEAIYWSKRDLSTQNRFSRATHQKENGIWVIQYLLFSLWRMNECPFPCPLNVYVHLNVCVKNEFVCPNVSNQLKHNRMSSMSCRLHPSVSFALGIREYLLPFEYLSKNHIIDRSCCVIQHTDEKPNFKTNIWSFKCFYLYLPLSVWTRRWSNG